MKGSDRSCPGDDEAASVIQYPEGASTQETPWWPKTPGHQEGHAPCQKSLLLVVATGMHSDVEHYIKNSERCALAKLPQPRVRPNMGNPSTNLQVTVFLLWLMCLPSIPMQCPQGDQKAATTAKVLAKERFLHYSVPRSTLTKVGTLRVN